MIIVALCHLQSLSLYSASDCVLGYSNETKKVNLFEIMFVELLTNRVGAYMLIFCHTIKTSIMTYSGELVTLILSTSLIEYQIDIFTDGLLKQLVKHLKKNFIFSMIRK